MKKSYLIIITLILCNVSIFSQKTAFTSKDALHLKSFSISDITEDGKYITGFTRSRMDRLNTDHKQFGNPNYIQSSSSNLVIIKTMSGEKIFPFENKGIFRRTQWSPDGKTLAILKNDNLDFNLYLFTVSTGKLKKFKFNSDKKIASNSPLIWSQDGESIVVSVRDYGWTVKGDSLFNEATIGPIIEYDSKRPFLKWDEIRNFSSLSILVEINLKSREVKELTKQGNFGGLRFSKKGKDLIYTQNYPLKTVYDRKNGTEYELKRIDFDKDYTSTVLNKKTKKRLNLSWNKLNTQYAYVDSGMVFIRSIVEDSAVKISMDTTEIIKSDTSKVKFSVNQWSPDGKFILASSKSGYWLINIITKDMERVYEFPEDKETAPGLRIIHWSSDSKHWYMSYTAKDKWERGIVKYSLSDRKFTDLVKDENLYSRWIVSENGEHFFYNYSDGNKPNNLFVFDKDFKNPKQLTDLNPWIENKKITKSELIKYRDADGNELNGILYYPVDYEEGKKYPLVCEIYETFFNNGYSMSMNLIANAGYFGFKPSVKLEKGYPGEAWIKGITSGINLLIEKGLVDENKLGVHGTSYGGYATSLLISQTDRFAAAINISGKVNIISFLGDSPRIGTRNYTAAEVGQDRIGQTLWQAPLKYIETSAVLFADRIKTPHLLLTGDGDWNVPAVNSRELYYALRRLGKEVVWVNYFNGGHGAGAASNESDFHDHWKRILAWYQIHFEKEDK